MESGLGSSPASAISKPSSPGQITQPLHVHFQICKMDNDNLLPRELTMCVLEVEILTLPRISC